MPERRNSGKLEFFYAAATWEKSEGKLSLVLSCSFESTRLPAPPPSLLVLLIFSALYLSVNYLLNDFITGLRRGAGPPECSPSVLPIEPPYSLLARLTCVMLLLSILFLSSERASDLVGNGDIFKATDASFSTSFKFEFETYETEIVLFFTFSFR